MGHPALPEQAYREVAPSWVLDRDIRIVSLTRPAPGKYDLTCQAVQNVRKILDITEPDSIVCTDMFWAYNALEGSNFHHHRIDHLRLFAKQDTISMGLKILEPGKAAFA